MKTMQHLDDLIKAVQEHLEKGDFDKLKNALAHKPGVTDAAGLAAKIGRDKLGEKEMEARSKAGKEKAKKDDMGGAEDMMMSEKTKKAEKSKLKEEGSPEHEKREKEIGKEIDRDAKELVGMHKATPGAPKPPKAPAPTLDYSKINAPKKAPEAAAPTITYSHTAAPVRTAGETEAGFKVPKEKTKVLSSPTFRTSLANQRRAAGVMKSNQEIADLMEKADKDELFPDDDAKMEMKAADWTPDKESAASSVFYSIQRLQEIKNQSWLVPQKHPEAKKALEYLYEEEKKCLARHIKQFKDGKPRKDLTKAEVFNTVSAESLTKSMRDLHTDSEITMMLKTAYDSGKIHRTVLMEWANFRTINPAVVALVKA